MRIFFILFYFFRDMIEEIIFTLNYIAIDHNGYLLNPQPHNTYTVTQTLHQLPG